MELYAVPRAPDTIAREGHPHAPAAQGAPRRLDRLSPGVPVLSPLLRAADDQLQEADAAVRAHEAAHMAAAGPAAAAGPSFVYLVGPDGRMYAVGGSVRVNVTPVLGDPETTIRRAKALIQAAYAVGMPSAADMRIAAEAYEMEMQAQRELERFRERSAERGPRAGIAAA